MSKQPVLRVGVGDYDHTRDLWNGRVKVPQCELECTPVATPEEIFSRFLDGGEWDAAEMSFAIATARRGRGDDSLVVLPVFPARAFRHSAIFVAAEGPQTPAELAGTRIGIPVWTQTAGVFARGLLAADFGLDLSSVHWVQAGVNEPGRREPVDIDLKQFDVRSEPAATLDRLLLDGAVDAVISARPPACVERRDRRVRRLFPKFTFDEMKYAETTGIFPIMHVLVVRREAYAANPAVADGLIDAFTQAKDRSLARALTATVPSYPLPWAASNAQRARDVIGDDFWPYGVEANRRTLDAFLGYAAEQEITPRRLTADELFAR
jgi:4,5-dihydroxyphthalate decarboxylase